MTQSIERSLGRVEEKLDAIHERVINIESYVEDDKKQKYMRKGAVMLLSVIGGGLATVIGFAVEMWVRS